MKAVMVTNPGYFRRVDATLVTVLELGKPLAVGDVLSDVINEDEYVVDGLGPPPRMSYQTAPALHWSRMGSATFRGKCTKSEGRLLFAGAVSTLCCFVIDGQITAKDQELPIEVPIIGTVRLRDMDCPALLKISGDMNVQVVVLAKEDTNFDRSLDYVCVSENGIIIEVQINAKSLARGAEAGRLLAWCEDDTPIVML